MDRPSRLPLYVGILLGASGWAAMGLGWYQSGQQELQTGQIPYLMSGGFGGWGLLLMGVVGVLLDAIRQAAWRVEQGQRELQGSRAEGGKREPSERDGPRRPRRRSRRRGGHAGGPAPDDGT